eukprot:gene498-531_t
MDKQERPILPSFADDLSGNKQEEKSTTTAPRPGADISHIVSQVKKEEERLKRELGYDPFKPHLSSQSQARVQIDRAVHGDMVTEPTVNSFPSPGRTPPPAYPSAGAQSEYNTLERGILHAEQINIEDEQKVEEALALLVSVPDATVTETALRTVRKILLNLLESPLDPKLQSIRVTNPSFQKKVVSCPGGLDLLCAAGFDLAEEPIAVGSAENNDAAYAGKDSEDGGRREGDTVIPTETYLRYLDPASERAAVLLRYTADRQVDAVTLVDLSLVHPTYCTVSHKPLPLPTPYIEGAMYTAVLKYHVRRLGMCAS